MFCSKGRWCAVSFYQSFVAENSCLLWLGTRLMRAVRLKHHKGKMPVLIVVRTLLSMFSDCFSSLGSIAITLKHLLNFSPLLLSHSLIFSHDWLSQLNNYMLTSMIFKECIIYISTITYCLFIISLIHYLLVITAKVTCYITLLCQQHSLVTQQHKLSNPQKRLGTPKSVRLLILVNFLH